MTRSALQYDRSASSEKYNSAQEMSVSVVLPSTPKLPEAPRTLREPPEPPPEPSRRRTTEEIFGNPAKRQRLQELARERMGKEEMMDMIDALVATRKETNKDPLRCVIKFLNK